MQFLCPAIPSSVAFLCRTVNTKPFVLAKGQTMYDAIYLLLGLGGFVVCLGFVQLCDRL